SGLRYLYTMRVTQSGDYIYIVDGSSMDDEGASTLGDIEEAITDKMIDCFNGIKGYEFSENEEWGSLISGYAPIKNATGEVIGILGADFDASLMKEKLLDSKNSMILFLVAILSISILAITLFSFLIVRSIKRLQSKIHFIQEGNLTIHVSDHRGDEIGSLSRSFQSMLNNMSQMISNIRFNSSEVMNDVDSLTESVITSNQSTEKITSIINNIADGAAIQLDNVNIVANTMERVSDEITSITEYINRVNKDSDQSIQGMKTATEILQSSTKQINLVNDSIENTALIMKLLEEKFQEMLTFSSSVAAIASRTNLLALNASIEAASVGEQGKGFAVVASEIKKLAEQSGEASKRINELIALVQGEISNSRKAIETDVIEARNSVEVMSEVESHLGNVSTSTHNIDTRIKDIDKAIQNIEEDSKNVLSKITGLANISKDFYQGTKQTATETEEQLAIIEEIKQHLFLVKGRMEDLQGSVNQFKVNNDTLV
ncbi:MAG TPA: methyl-accepting chemotaxis protein, partial [Lachnospiraceae bacterium]|nr:methyl-accepting chemotaxis protein [Lachnospiraceae bacterium]